MTVTPAPGDLPLALRAAMRQLAGGVSLITVGDGAERGGFTATSVTSLTLDPPCVLACVNRAVSALPRILSGRRFGVSVLADHHQPLAQRFSGQTGVRGAARFAEGRWEQTASGIPLLADALAGLACDLEDTIERHSHLILVGNVHLISFGATRPPLIYARGGYGRFDPLDEGSDAPSRLPPRARRQASEQ